MFAKTLAGSLALTLALALAGCADEGDATIDPGAGAQDAGKDVFVPPPPKDSGTTNKDSGTGPQVCVSSCNADTECQNSCPAVQNGINCCDIATHVCFASQTQTCPVQEDPDSGTQPY